MIKNKDNAVETPCNANIDISSTCEDIPVQYQWRVCNGEDRAIRINRSKSKYKNDGEVEGNVDAVIESKQCIEYFKDSVLNTCDKEKAINSCKNIQCPLV